jgi:hypothetical protein
LARAPVAEPDDVRHVLQKACDEAGQILRSASEYPRRGGLLASSASVNTALAASALGAGGAGAPEPLLGHFKELANLPLLSLEQRKLP